MQNTSNSKIALITALSVALLVSAASRSGADTLVGYAPTGPTVNGPLAPSTVDTGVVTATSLTRGTGTSGYDSAGGNTNFFSAYYTGGSDATLSDAVANGIYLTFSVTAGATPVFISGLNLSNDFFFQDANNYSIEDSVTGFGSSSSNVLASVPYANSRYSAGPTLTFATPERLSAGQTDTFRIYVDSLNTYTDFGIGDGGSTPSNPNAFEVIGQTVPEPSTYAFLGAGLLLVVVVARSRRSTLAS